MTIQVSNLPSTVTDAQLDNLKARFSSFGKVNKFEVTIIVQLESGEDAAIKALNGQLLEAQPIEVKGVKEGEESNNSSSVTSHPGGGSNHGNMKPEGEVDPPPPSRRK